MSNDKQPNRPRGRVIDVLSTAAGVFLMCFALGVGADDRNRQRDAADSEATKEELRCVHGCQRWGKVCNTDPRGVYKCRRICERFGEICE